MSLNRRTHRRWLVTAGLLGASGLAIYLAASPSAAAGALVAGSVCEAHELKARKALDPSLEIEIPAQFDKPFPSRDACISHEEAWNENNAGPRQPIPFSHKHHAGKFQMDCLYCHSGTDRSRAAGVPSVELCMGCHAQFPAEYDELEGIRILKEHWQEKKPVQWAQVHRLPEHAKFRHNRHVQFGLDCSACHGQVQDMERVAVQDQTTWKYFVPAKTLEMGWCIQCHNKPEHQASVDCMTCHY